MIVAHLKHGVTIYIYIYTRIYIYIYTHTFIVQNFDRGIVCTPLSINVFVTLATQQNLEYHCKVIFETPCIASGSNIQP
jgi:hypothetical protein